MAKDKVQHKRRAAWTPLAEFFAAVSILLVALYDWPLRWCISGTPILVYVLLRGEASGYRIFPFAPLWTLISTINLAYAVSATSWLLYWVHTTVMYPTIFLACLFQFESFSRVLRRRLRNLLKELHFTSDKLGYFDLPALEIDRDVDGLMVIRGLTISFSSLTIVAHGIEVGIKFSDDLELALAVDTTTIKLFRSIHVGHVYGNVKGGEHEMTFWQLDTNSTDDDGDALMNSNTAILNKAASASSESLTLGRKMKMTEEMTNKKAPEDVSAKDAIHDITLLHPDDHEAHTKYSETLQWIHDTSSIQEARKAVDKALDTAESANFDHDDEKGMRAAICTHLHDMPTVPHPPRRSIRVTTLQNLSPPYVRRFMHRLPLLLRILLNVLSYFHPVHIASVTVGGSGKWMQHMIHSMIFKEYDLGSSDIKHLAARLSRWLWEANFALQLIDIKGLASVPINVIFDIIADLSFGDVLMYRTVASQVRLKEVVRLGGADARIKLPAFLLPHHEHLLPPKATEAEKLQQKLDVADADGKPNMILAQHALEQTEKDETNGNVSVHVRLPACFDQELLDFVTALVKATKIIEIDRASDVAEEHAEKEMHGMHHLKHFGKKVKTEIKDGLKKATVDAMLNDRWIAKIVGKITKKLETAQGDIGYSGELPIPLKIYRDNAEDAPKILP